MVPSRKVGWGKRVAFFDTRRKNNYMDNQQGNKPAVPMKECPQCKAEIPASAKKCSHCGSELRGWPRRHPFMAFVLSVITLFIVMSIIGSIGKSGETQQGSAPTSNAVAQPTAMTVTVTKLASDYQANEVSADAKYKGQLLNVTGTVSSISKDFLDDPYVLLSSGSDNIVSDVQCSFSQSDNSKLASLSKGQQVTLQGTDNGMTLNTVELQNCLIITQ